MDDIDPKALGPIQDQGDTGFSWYANIRPRVIDDRGRGTAVGHSATHAYESMQIPVRLLFGSLLAGGCDLIPEVHRLTRRFINRSSQ